MPTEPTGGQRVPALSAHHVVKRFGETLALAGVSLEVYPGEVLGLVGANGAGKSTLIKIMSGVERPSSGHLEVAGRPVVLDGAHGAAAVGIETVHQAVDQALVADLTVAENLVLDRLAAGTLGRFPGRRRIEAAARSLAGDRLRVDLGATVADLGTSDRQQVLIARALASHPSVLVLDEPTAALSVVEQRELHGSVRALAAAGTAVVYITHHLGEVGAVCDRVVALRDGEVTGTFTAPVDLAMVAGAILGDLAPAADRPSRPGPGAASRGRAVASGAGHAADAPLLTLSGLRAWPGAAPVDLTVRSGEVVGITGLLGAGKTELLTQVIGAAPLVGGTMTLAGRPFRPGHPADAVAAGIGFVPEDRQTQAEVPDWSVTANLTLPDLRRYRRGRLLSPRAERAAARRAVADLSIVCAGPDAPIWSLSGGNRQKVVVARWLAARSRLLILDEPFRGVDIGARADIAALLRSGAVEAAVVASSDPEEILEVADRVLVMSGGTVVGEVLPAEADAELLAALMTATVAGAAR